MTDTPQVPIWRYDEIIAYSTVDAADFAKLNQQRWRLAGPGYAMTGRDRYMARELMGLSPGDRRAVHHINEQKLDNRRANLMVCASKSEAHRQPHPNRVKRTGWANRLRLHTFEELCEMSRMNQSEAAA